MHFLAMCQITHGAPSGSSITRTPPSLPALSGSLQSALRFCSSPPHWPARSWSFSPVTECTLSLPACTLPAHLLCASAALNVFTSCVGRSVLSSLFFSLFFLSCWFVLFLFVSAFSSWLDSCVLSCESLPAALDAVRQKSFQYTLSEPHLLCLVFISSLFLVVWHFLASLNFKIYCISFV